MISLEQARTLSYKFNVIPVVKKLFSGVESPVSIYEKVAKDRKGTFLLESAEHGVWSRYSFIGASFRGTISKDKDVVSWVSRKGESALPNGKTLPEAGLLAIEALTKSWVSDNESELPPLTSGLVGFLSWSMIREIEDMPPRNPSKYAIPDFSMAMLQDCIVVDHQTGSLLLVANIYLDGEVELEKEYSDAVSRIDSLIEILAQPSEPFLAEEISSADSAPAANMTIEQFNSMIDSAGVHIRRGDVFQVVLSQRFETKAPTSNLDAYRMLRALNPSPYMYLLELEDDQGDYAIVGSSPEALVTVSHGRAVMHPIAGSRPRGSSWDADANLETELLGDSKERAEHLMLVDLARNDLLKVCEPTSVTVSEFMQIHKFSHIQHLVSTVEGTVSATCSPVDVFRATFPAGTLSGAPKPKALEIIEALEPVDRGLFGGVVGYFDFNGNSDLAIAIRTALIRDGKAYVQAGAGIVLDSIRENERLETIAKAAAPLRAINAAANLLHLK